MTHAEQGFDVFICHAAEDKAAVARPLYDKLTAMGFTVWYDDAILQIGDSLRQRIDEGLRVCRHGVVIISPSFFAKNWPQRELNGLVAREMASGDDVILPVWHNVTEDQVRKYSSPLADKVAAGTNEGLDAVVARIARKLGRRREVAVTRQPHDDAPLTAEQKEELRRTYLRGGRPLCPRDGGILHFQDITTFGSLGKSFYITCPICGLNDKLPSPQAPT